jgi:hypothetical protein
MLTPAAVSQGLAIALHFMHQRMNFLLHFRGRQFPSSVKLGKRGKAPTEPAQFSTQGV